MKNENSFVLTEEQAKALEGIKADLLKMLALEQAAGAEADKDKEVAQRLEIEKTTEKLAVHTVVFYATSTTDALQLISIATLKERILNFIEKGHFLEGYIFSLLKSRLEIKNRYISKITTPFKQEVVYEINFSKIQKLANR